MTSEPVVIVSNDTHVGPRLVEDLRNPYLNGEVIRLDGGARLSIAMGPRSS